MNTFVKSKAGILSPKGALGPKQDKHRCCVGVAAITRYQPSRRQQHIPGVVTCGSRRNASASETTSETISLSF